VPASSEPAVHDSRPPWLGTVGAVCAALLVIVMVLDSVVGVALAACGAGLVCLGLWRGHRLTVTLGSTASFGAVLSVGTGRGPLWLLGATVPVVLTWALGGHALALGRQVGRTGETWRVETVHALTTLVVVVLGGAIGYVGYRSVTGARSPLAIALLLGGVLAAVLVLRDTTT
jgi:hypothetical protein